MDDATVTLPHDTLQQLRCDDGVRAASRDMASLSQLAHGQSLKTSKVWTLLCLATQNASMPRGVKRVRDAGVCDL
jgi:hypothetical protein